MIIFGLIFVSVTASHFRAGSISFLQGARSDEIIVERTRSWRLEAAGYGRQGCTQQDIDDKLVSRDGNIYENGLEFCEELESQQSCGVMNATYIVTDIEDSLEPANNYCYGYQHSVMKKPTKPFKVHWESCCWVYFTTDDGELIWGDVIRLTATIFNLENNSPIVKIPQIWRIMSGCNEQAVHLSPFDLDGDTVRCRWAEYGESDFASMHDPTNFGSLNLNRESCILSYDTDAPPPNDGVKPITLMIEDFDLDGKVKSSIPVQFLAVVWTPEIEYLLDNARSSFDGKVRPYQFPPFFEEEMHDDLHHHPDLSKYQKPSTTKRPTTRQRPDLGILSRGSQSRNEPVYCRKKPIFNSPTPDSDMIIPVHGHINIPIWARTQNGVITRYEFNSPLGMTCTDVTNNGVSICNWIPKADQVGISTFCFSAEDSQGFSSERRCINLKVENQVIDTSTMVDHFKPSVTGLLATYGCAGVGQFDHFSTNVGIPIDDVDFALHRWRLCMRCATKSIGAEVVPYDFDENENICENDLGSIKRAVCECDKELGLDLVDLELKVDSIDYNVDDCISFMHKGSGKCCLSDSGVYSWHHDWYGCTY